MNSLLVNKISKLLAKLSKYFRVKRFMLYKLGWDKSACVLCEHEEIIHTIKKRADSSHADNSVAQNDEALHQGRLKWATSCITFIRE